jgi:hypothetical protein
MALLIVMSICRGFNPCCKVVFRTSSWFLGYSDSGGTELLGWSHSLVLCLAYQFFHDSLLFPNLNELTVLYWILSQIFCSSSIFIFHKHFRRHIASQVISLQFTFSVSFLKMHFNSTFQSIPWSRKYSIFYSLYLP